MQPLSNQKMHVANSNVSLNKNNYKQVNQQNLLKLKNKITELYGNEKYYNKAIDSAEWKQKVISGEKKLYVSDERYLLLCAKNLYSSTPPKQNKFNEVLNKIKADVSSGEILDEKGFMVKYDLEEVLKECSPKERGEQLKEFRTVINTAYVAHILRQKGKIATLGKDEQKLLRAFGLLSNKGLENYDKESVYTSAKEDILKLKNEEFLSGPQELVKERIETCCLKARLSSIGVTSDLQIAKFQCLKEKFSYLNDSLKLKEKDIPLILPESFSKFSIPYNQKSYIENLHKNLKGKTTNSFLTSGFKSLAPEFLDNNCNIQDFNKITSDKLDSFVSTKLINLKERWEGLLSAEKPNPKLKARVDFFEKWGANIHNELEVQDQQEVLNNGVCWAKSEHLMHHVLNEKGVYCGGP